MWLAVTVMVSVNLARSSATSAVMILVVLAMRMHRPASFSNNISPLSASIRIAAAADSCTASARQGSSASSIAQAAQAVCPDGNERNSSDDTPSATSWFLRLLPAFHHGVK